jgi:AraC-like DNA-binding protein
MLFWLKPQDLTDPLMVKARSNERIYSAAKIAAIVDALAIEGVSAAAALEDVGVSHDTLNSPTTRVALDQIIECYHNATRLTQDPHFALHLGLKAHVSAYGMYGFTLLSGTDFRKIMKAAVKYHRLVAPLAEIAFHEDGEQASWSMSPIPHPRVDVQMYRFLVELQIGTHWSLMRDFMGQSFAPRELAVTFKPPHDVESYRAAFGCPVHFNCPHNKLVFDTAYLDSRPELGNEITYLAVVRLCESLLAELELRGGTAGKVREILLVNLMRPTSFETVASRLHMTTRTLRRKLGEEGTSFRRLVDELKMEVAVKYLRDTELPVDEIAYSLGFSEASIFRRAFRRWTSRSPREFRDHEHSVRN